MAIRIVTGNLQDVTTASLIAEHVAEQHGNVPAGFGFAMNVNALASPDIAFWVMMEQDSQIGFGALKTLNETEGEVKSMRVLPSHRGKGLGSRMLQHIIAEARQRGMQTLYLETGGSSIYDAAIALYKRAGFQPCGPFADYTASDYNQFFKLNLTSQVSST